MESTHPIVPYRRFLALHRRRQRLRHRRKKLFEIFYTISEFLIDPAQHIEEVRIGGMGLINTGVRLKMFVGMQAVFEIHKSVLGGTEVHIGGTVHDPRICC